MLHPSTFVARTNPPLAWDACREFALALHSRPCILVKVCKLTDNTPIFYLTNWPRRSLPL